LLQIVSALGLSIEADQGHHPKQFNSDPLALQLLPKKVLALKALSDPSMSRPRKKLDEVRLFPERLQPKQASYGTSAAMGDISSIASVDFGPHPNEFVEVRNYTT